MVHLGFFDDRKPLVTAGSPWAARFIEALAQPLWEEDQTASSRGWGWFIVNHMVHQLVELRINDQHAIVDIVQNGYLHDNG